MNFFEQKIISPGRCRVGKGVFRNFSAPDLKSLRENTLALMRRGYQVTVLKQHATPGDTAGGPKKCIKSHQGRASDEVAGRIVDIRQDTDGALIYVLKLNPELARGVEFGDIRHTSPELRSAFTDDRGRKYGPIIAHVALTDRPRNPDQSPLCRVTPSDLHANDPVNFSFDNPQSGTLTMNKEQSYDSLDDASLLATSESEQGESIPAEVVNASPEQPVGKEDEQIPDAEPLPPEDDFDDLEELPETDRQTTQPTSETVTDREQSALPVDSDDNIETPGPEQEEASTARQDLYRTQLSQRIRLSKRLPKGLRDRLAEVVETIQLSQDGAEQPTLRVSDAVSMIEEAMPAHVQLDPDRLQRPGHPAGEAFFTGDPHGLSDEEAERIAREQLTSSGFYPRKVNSTQP